jgi:D-lactate dehydrogenase
MFDTKGWVVSAFNHQLQEMNLTDKIKIEYIPNKLGEDSTLLAANSQVVCCFVNDDVNGNVVRKLSSLKVGLIAMRSAGFYRVDLKLSSTLNIPVMRVPAYSPYAVAEHAVALLMALNRKIHLSYDRTRDGNFSLEGLHGFDIHGKTVGVVGTGKIGQVFTDIVLGFGCDVICYDIYPNSEFSKKKGVKYVELEEIWKRSDIISLHAPLTKETTHILNISSFGQMKKGVVILNTSRGGLVDTKALLDALLSGQVAAAGLDVYEGERDYFFEDNSSKHIKDPVLAHLLSFNNVIVTGHQAFLTVEATRNIACTTLKNILDWREGKLDKHPNLVQ